jgi:hypothetical protein
MTTLRSRVTVVAVVALLTLFVMQVAGAADALVVTAKDTGGISVSKAPLAAGARAPLSLQLNAHATDWVNVAQDAAKITDKQASDKALQFTGTLAIPGDKGGDLGFKEQIGLDAGTLNASYTVKPAKALTVFGLQVSVNLDTAVYKGGVVTVSQVKAPAADAAAGAAVETEAITVALPAEASGDNFTLYSETATKIEVATADGIPFTLTVPQPCKFVIQDNRKWENPVFEIRLVLEMDANGLELAADKEYKPALAFKFGAPLAFAGK